MGSGLAAVVFVLGLLPTNGSEDFLYCHVAILERLVEVAQVDDLGRGPRLRVALLVQRQILKRDPHLFVGVGQLGDDFSQSGALENVVGEGRLGCLEPCRHVPGGKGVLNRRADGLGRGTIELHGAPPSRLLGVLAELRRGSRQDVLHLPDHLRDLDAIDHRRRHHHPLGIITRGPMGIDNRDLDLQTAVLSGESIHEPHRCTLDVLSSRWEAVVAIVLQLLSDCLSHPDEVCHVPVDDRPVGLAQRHKLLDVGAASPSLGLGRHLGLCEAKCSEPWLENVVLRRVAVACVCHVRSFFIAVSAFWF